MGVDNLDKQSGHTVTDLMVSIHKEDPFIVDPFGYIDQKAWEDITGQIEFFRSDKNWRSFAELATPARLLFPGQALDLGSTDQLLKDITQGLSTHHDFNEWHSFSLLAEYAALFHRGSLEKLGIDRKLGNEFLLIVKAMTKKHDFLEALRFSKRGLVIWPELFQKHNTEQYFEDIPLGIGYLHQMGPVGVKRALECAALGCFVFPQNRQKLNLNPDFFDTVHTYLADLKQIEDYFSLVKELFHLTAITYPFSRIDSSGYMIVRDETVHLGTPVVPLPARRRF